MNSNYLLLFGGRYVLFGGIGARYVLCGGGGGGGVFIGWSIM